MRKFSAKWDPKCLNADQKRKRRQSSEQNLEFFRRDSNDFLSRLVTMDETSLYHYDPETKQHSMKWGHSGSNCPQKFRMQKIRWKISRLIDSKRPNYQRGVLLISAGTIGGHFEGKTPRENHQRSFSCTKMPRLTRHFQPRINWPTWASIVLITHPILQIWPRRTTNCSLDWKNNWNFAIFCPTQRSFLPRRPGWTDNVLNFFWVACKR